MEQQTILVVDDNKTNIRILNEILKGNYIIKAATNGFDALKLAFSEDPPDLILLDIMMPCMDGYSVCRYLKDNETTAKIPILFVTNWDSHENEAMGLSLGAVDYIVKPISPPILRARVRNHLELKRHQDRLEELVNIKTKQLKEGCIDTIHRLTLASEYRDEDTGKHIKRISYYSKALAEQLGFDREYCERLFFASPMHDIGKVAIPDSILLKKGLLDKQEWRLMQTHTEIGAKILEDSKSPYLCMAKDIALYHHERWDGRGYPYGLKGKAIPIAARLTNIVDQYDALRSKRPYKPVFDHQEVLSIITQGDGRTLPEHFDPDVLAAFTCVADTFADIYENFKD
jgi:putative two-component system response regulator